MALSEWDEIRMLMREAASRADHLVTEIEKDGQMDVNAGEEIDVLDELVERARRAWERMN